VSSARALPTPFRRGYVASSVKPALRDLAEWRRKQFATWWFALHPETFWASARHGAVQVAIVGEPVDIDRETTNRKKIAQHVAASLAISADRAIRHVAYLGGRASYFLLRDGELIVVPDYASTHPVFWHQTGAKTTISNYAHLAGEVSGAALNEPYIDLMRRARELGANRTIYWPGVETPFVGVSPVLVHHLLRVRQGRAARHERFYPFPDTDVIRDVDTAYAAFREAFLCHTRLLTSMSKEIGVSLTGGLDSRTTLASALPHTKGSRVRTWTYLNRSPDRAILDDAYAARELARERGLRHDIVLVGGRSQGLAPHAFDRAYKRSFRYTSQLPAVPKAYVSDLPASIVELQSMVAECGTGFYKDRSEPFSLDRVVRLYQNSPFGEVHLVREAFERYVEYSGLTPDDVAPLDWHDVLYQESRIGRWGSLRIQEVELAHRIHLPFNARGIVEALSGPELPFRVKKQALERLVRDLG